MKVSTAVRVFGSRAKIYKALREAGHQITRSAVYQWPEQGLVPIERAPTLAALKPTKLSVDQREYLLEKERRYRRVGDVMRAKFQECP